MKKRLLKLTAFLLITAGVVALLVPGSYFTLTGLLRNEASYRGQPTSYWASAWRKEEMLLGKVGPGGDIGKILRDGGQEAVPVLLEMLREEDQGLRHQVLLTLFLVGPANPQASEFLIPIALHDEDRARRGLAFATLFKADRPAALNLCQELAVRPEPEHLQLLADYLTGLEASVTVPLLERVLSNNENPRHRAWAATHLSSSSLTGRITLGTGRPCPVRPELSSAEALALVRVAHYPDPLPIPAGRKSGKNSPRCLDRDLIESAKDLLRPDLEPAAPWKDSAEAALRRALVDHDELVQVTAANALWTLTGNTDEILPVVLAALDHQDVGVRTEARYGLTRVARQAPSALAASLVGVDARTAEAVKEYLGQGTER